MAPLHHHTRFCLFPGGNSAYDDGLEDALLLPVSVGLVARVLDVDENLRRVRQVAQSALLRRYRLADAGRLREVPLRLDYRLSRLNKPQVGFVDEGGLFIAKVVNEKVIIISRRGVSLPQTSAVLF
jgi:hypothetical protein